MAKVNYVTNVRFTIETGGNASVVNVDAYMRNDDIGNIGDKDQKQYSNQDSASTRIKVTRKLV